MYLTRVRSFSRGRGGRGGAMTSRSKDNRRIVPSTRCARTSRTVHEPAEVGRSQTSGGSWRRTRTNSSARGRKNGRVSITDGDLGSDRGSGGGGVREGEQ